MRHSDPSEQHLQQKSRQLEAILQATPNGIIAVDLADRITLSNTRAATLFGMPKHEMIGRLLIDFITEDLRDDYRSAFTAVRAADIPRMIETEICRENGNPIPVEISIGLQHDNEQPVGYCLIVANLTDKRRIEEELKENEAQFRHIINALPQFVAYVNPDLTYRYANQTSRSFFGLAPEQLIGRKTRDIIGAKAHDAIKPYLQQVLSGQSAHYQRDLIYPDNKLHTIDGQLIPDLSASGQVRGYFAILYDITHLREAHDALRESEAKMRSIFRVAPIGIGMTVDRIITEVNDRLCNMLGYRQEELIGRPSRLLYSSDEAHRAAGEQRRRQIKRQGRSTMEIQMRHKNGAEITVLVNAAPLPIGEQTIGIIFTVLDITKRKQAELLARNQSITMDAIFNSTPCILVLVNEAGRVEQINRRGSEFFGASQDAVRGQSLGLFFNCVNVFGTDDCGCCEACQGCPVRSRITNTLATGSSYREEEGTMTLRRDDGDIVYHLLISTVAINIDGQAKVLVAITDISEIKKKEAELIRQRLAHQELEQQYRQAQKMEPVGRLAGGIAHDLNNLLAPIIGYSEMLTEEMSDHDPRRTSVEQIFSAGQRARDLIRQLLAFSRKQTLTLSDINLNRLISGFHNLLRRTIREDIEIILHLDESLPSIQGDTGQLEQVILNLAVNAQDAMPNSGSLTFRTEVITLDAVATAKQELTETGRYVRLTVSDSGFGMTPDTCAQIFEPFFTTKDQQHGTGLGLSTVYGIIRQHQGTISVHSKPGAGTTFSIYLPATTPPISVQETPDKSPLGTGMRGNETVLLAEDDVPVRSMIETLLQQHGYTVLSIGNGKEALTRAQAHPGNIHLLLSDVVMPEMNGRELYEQLVYHHPQIKSLFMSGYPDDVFGDNFISKHAVHFIQKPFAIKDLLTMVRRILDQSTS